MFPHPHITSILLILTFATYDQHPVQASAPATACGDRRPTIRTTLTSNTMPSPFPTTDALSATFGTATPYQAQPVQKKRSPYEARSELFGAWSVAEDAKKQAAKLSDAATKEYEQASQAARAKAGKMELYSGKYYAVGPSYLSA